MDFTPKFVDLVRSVALDTAEVTYLDLFDAFGLLSETSTLEKLIEVHQHLESLKWKLLPDQTSGEVDSLRRLVLSVQSGISEETCRQEISQVESSRLEFKSSLFYDHVRALREPTTSLRDLKSEILAHACLKTLAGYANTGGGVLYIGVNNEGSIVGVEDDFRCISSSGTTIDFDRWQLTFRDLIKGRFKDGNTVNNYVFCQGVWLEGKQVARVQVSPRTLLSYLQALPPTQGFQVFVRQGNRTIQVGIEQMEELVLARRDRNSQ